MGLINEEKILKEANISAKLNFEFADDRKTAIWGFKDGVKWAEYEYTNSLWHDYTELPDFKQPIVYTIKCSFNSIQSLNYPNKDLFDAIFRMWGEFKWAYSKDVLPKEYFKI